MWIARSHHCVKKKMPRCGVFVPVDQAHNYLYYLCNRMNAVNVKQICMNFKEAH